MLPKLIPFIALAIAASVSVCADVSVRKYPLCDGGFVCQWLICGAFPNDGAAGSKGLSGSAYDLDLLASVGGETACAPTPGEVVKAGMGYQPVTWTPKGFDKYVALDRVMKPNTENAAAYGFCYLDADEAARIDLKIGSTDSIKVWLNGELALSERGEGGPVPDQHKVTLPLRKGLNSLLVKSCQGNGDWGWYARVELEGTRQPARGVEVALPVGSSSAVTSVTYPPLQNLPLPSVGPYTFQEAPARSRARITLIPGRDTGPVKLAADKLVARLRALGVTASVRSFGTMGQCGTTDIVVAGSEDAKLWKMDPWGVDLNSVSRPDSYAIVSRDEKIYVLGKGEMGIVNGLSFLQTRLWRNAANKAVYNLDSLAAVYNPAFSRRVAYINIGYNLPGITVQDWTLDQWKEYIDRLVLARLNAFSFFLWTDTYSIMPETTTNRARNEQLHSMLRDAVRYARQRGLKVTYLIGPTLLPADVFARYKDEMASEPLYPGFPLACPSSDRGKQLMSSLVSAEIGYFNECDDYQVAFFDPGGCGCNRCKANMADTLIGEMGLWSSILRQHNPSASLSAFIWPFKVLESNLGISFGSQFLSKAKSAYGNALDICEAADPVRVYLQEAKQMGLQTTAFNFITNPETGFIYPIVSGGLWKDYTNQVAGWGFDRSMFHRLEARTRQIQDWLMGCVYWDTQVDLDRSLLIYASQMIGRSDKGSKLASVFKAVDQFADLPLDPANPSYKMELAAGIGREAGPLLPYVQGYDRWYSSLGRLYPSLARCLYARYMLSTTADPEWAAELAARRQEHLGLLATDSFYGGCSVGHMIDSYFEYLTQGRSRMLF